MKKSSVFRIPEPCHENWEGMTPAERGRFCKACQKVVRDFTKSSEADMLAAYEASGGKLCGKVPARLLNRPIGGNSMNTGPLARMRMFLLAFLVAFGVEVFAMSPANTDLLRQEVASLYLHTPEPEGSDVEIRGTVYNSDDQEPAEHAIVMLFAGDKMVGRMETKADGEYEFRIPEALATRENLEIQVAWLGSVFTTHVKSGWDKSIDLVVWSNIELPTITIELEPGWDRETQISYVGLIIRDPIRVERVHYPGGMDGRFQQTTDERIWMHSSETHLSEF